MRDGDEDSDQRLESVASQVAERVLEEDENDKQVACVSRDTGDKGPNTHWVHGENIEIAVNM